MRQSHLILSNAVIMWITQIFQIIPQLILVPYLIGTIGEIGYGIYALVWALILSIDQLEKSSQGGVVKYSAAFFAKGLINELNKVISTSFVFSLFIAILTCLGIIVIALLYNDPSGQIRFPLIVVGIMILFIIPLTPYLAIIQSKQRYYVNAILDTISKYLSLLSVVLWFSVVGPSVESLVIIMAGMMFLSRLAQVPIAYHFVPGLQNNPLLFDKKIFRLIVTFGAVMIFASLCNALNTTGVRWLMDALESTRFVAHLAIMLMPVMLLSQIIEAMTITVMPATSAYEATGNQLMLQELLIRGMRYTMILSLVGLVAAGLFIKDALNIWVGPDYVFLAPYALVLFAARTFMLISSTAQQMLKGIGKLREVMFIYLIGFVILPIGMIIVIFAAWHDPYVAVTAGLSIGYVICGCLQTGFCSKAVNADLNAVLNRAYVQPLILAVPVGFASLCTINFFQINGLFARIIIFIITVTLFWGGFFLFFATAAERQQIQLAVNRIVAFSRTKLEYQKK